jgi:hypothetical protein
VEVFVAGEPFAFAPVLVKFVEEVSFGGCGGVSQALPPVVELPAGSDFDFPAAGVGVEGDADLDAIGLTADIDPSVGGGFGTAVYLNATHAIAIAMIAATQSTDSISDADS